MLTKTIIIPAKGRAEVIEEELDTSNLQPNEAVIQAEASMISAGTPSSSRSRSKADPSTVRWAASTMSGGLAALRPRNATAACCDAATSTFQPDQGSASASTPACA